MTERVWQLLLDSFSQILIPGLLVTIPLTILSFTFGLLIAIGTALVQIAQIPILKQVARFYIWVVRGTPLLVQLYVIFFGLPSLGIVLDAFPSAVLVFLSIQVPTLRKPYGLLSSPCLRGSWRLAILSG